MTVAFTRDKRINSQSLPKVTFALEMENALREINGVTFMQWLHHAVAYRMPQVTYEDELFVRIAWAHLLCTWNEVFWFCVLNSLWPSCAICRSRSCSSLVPGMAWRLFSPKPFPEHMTTYCLLSYKEHDSIAFYWNSKFVYNTKHWKLSPAECWLFLFRLQYFNREH